jgi:hypothetical protein
VGVRRRRSAIGQQLRFGWGFDTGFIKPFGVNPTSALYPILTKRSSQAWVISFFNTANDRWRREAAKWLKD